MSAEKFFATYGSEEQLREEIMSFETPPNFKNSRIGKKEIVVPKGVTVTKKDNVITVKGKKGTMERQLLPEAVVTIKDDKIFVTQNLDPKVYSRRSRSIHGLTRTLINNMVVGVSANCGTGE